MNDLCLRLTKAISLACSAHHRTKEEEVHKKHAADDDKKLGKHLQIPRHALNLVYLEEEVGILILRRCCQRIQLLKLELIAYAIFVFGQLFLAVFVKIELNFAILILYKVALIVGLRLICLYLCIKICVDPQGGDQIVFQELLELAVGELVLTFKSARKERNREHHHEHERYEHQYALKVRFH